jgi:hypothetical protein
VIIVGFVSFVMGSLTASAFVSGVYVSARMFAAIAALQ